MCYRDGPKTRLLMTVSWQLSQPSKTATPSENISPPVLVPSFGLFSAHDRIHMALIGPPSSSTRRTSLAVVVWLVADFGVPSSSTVLFARLVTSTAAGAASRTSIRTIVLSHTTATTVPAVPACCTLKGEHEEDGGSGRQEATLSATSDHAEDLTMLTESGVTCTM